jgi:hypothetical protein
MKKILFLFISFPLILFSQIVQEHVYNGTNLQKIRIANSFKYCILNNNTQNVFTIYNSDHSLFKTINIPSNLFTPPDYPRVDYVSDSLFNLDSNVEYLLSVYGNSGNNSAKTYIVNENGLILFNKDSVASDYFQGSYGENNGVIFKTETGTKMALFGFPHTSNINQKIYIYSLPGTLPNCQSLNTGIDGGIYNQEKSYLYPNPTNQFVTLKYKLPVGVIQGQIFVYNISGQKLIEKNVDNNFDDLLLDTNSLTNGVYFYSLVVNGNQVFKQKFIISK